MRKRTELIISLDTDTLKEAEKIADETSDLTSFYKIGPVLFTRYGPDFIERLAKKNKKVFLDMKLHDIPNTVAKATERAAEMGVYSLSVHILSGTETLKKAVMVENRPKLWGIAVLTSIDEKEHAFMGFSENIENSFFRLADIGTECGLDGLVCSGRELPKLRKRLPETDLIVPGIRPKKKADDQKRTTTPATAAENGADFIVVGRPVIKSENPRSAAEEILRRLNEF